MVIGEILISPQSQQPNLGVLNCQVADKSDKEHETLADKNGEEEGPADGGQVHPGEGDEKKNGQRVFSNKNVEAFCLGWSCDGES